ncbi:MAG: PASTA domain-containing protein, partial [Pyramidobacter sp.]|nr:PASTA domain-containing protein [Pyramidobacter sp.]
STLPRGTVIGQWPESGVTLRADKTAILKVSRGTEKQSLPDVRGLPQNQAVKKLQDAGFIVGEIQKIHHERPAGVVVAQNPASPVSVSPSREIGLLVSLGPSAASGTVIVPDLVERDEKTAEQLARESALRPRIEYVFDNSSPKGMVISMVPAAGRSVQRGSTVTLRVASWDSRLAPKKRDDQTGEKSAGGARVTIVEPGTDPEKGVVAANDPKTPPAAEKPAAEAKKPAAPRKKVASIRYQAPPVNNQTLVIEIVDNNGERRLLSRKVKAGENIRINAPYVGEAVVTIYLGGNFVWQDRYK